MKNYLFFIFIAATQLVNAQNKNLTKTKCGTENPPAAWDQWFNEQVEAFKQSEGYQKSQSANYTIPVIFHVIHGGQSEGTFPNISQAQINSQIGILNNDFAGTGLNVGNLGNTNFSQALIANCNVNFCLAQKDPSGTPLTQAGIHRVNYTANGWSNPTTFTSLSTFKGYIDNTVKPATIWDPTRYLNLWITDVNGQVGLLGYATFPSNSTLSGLTSGLGTATSDGVWCWTKAIGNTGTLFSPYDKGRTATHEIGHWLGLRHIWGDASCGTDYCNDTPTQQAANSGCPTYPSVTCSNGPNGDMFMNFMDYSDDICLYLFTPDQRTRIQTAMANSPFRSQLTASSATLCGAPPPVGCADTLSNFSVTDTLSGYRRASATASDPGCLTGPGQAGYIAGTNCFGDLEKAEFISYSKYSTAVNPIITGAIVLFFQYGNMGTDGTGNVSINIYNGSSATNAPGSLLGSKTENLGTIAATTNTNGVTYCGNPALVFGVPLIMPFKFVFSTPIVAPSSGGFFASVVLPTGAGDTVSVLDKRTGVTNTAWEKWSDNSWHDMKTAWGGSRNFNLAILPIVECGAAGVAERSILNEQVNLFPNPSNGKLNVFTNFKGEQQLDLNVFDVYGQLVYTKKITVIDASIIELDLTNETQGIYFLVLSKGAEKITKKFVLQK